MRRIRAKIGLVALSITSLAAVASAQQAAPIRTFRFQAPDLSGPGYPTSASYTGEGEGFENDPFFDDPVAGSSVEVEPGDGKNAEGALDITSIGDMLFDSEGNLLNGFGEDDCIEVYLEFEYQYTATVSRQFCGHGGAYYFGFHLEGGSCRTVTTTVILTGTTCSDTVEICPW